MLVAEGRKKDRMPRWFQRLLGLCVIFLLIGVFMDRILQVSLDVERAAFDKTLATLRAELNLYSLGYIMRHELPALRVYENTNPVRLIKITPENYQGEYSSGSGKVLPAGSWYYDVDTRELVYRVRQPIGFFRNNSKTDEVRYGVKFFDPDNDKSKRIRRSDRFPPGLRLELR